MLKINADLHRKITDILYKNPKISEQNLVQSLVQNNQIRLKKEIIKSGVREYLQNKQTKTNQTIQQQPKQQKSTLGEFQSIKKKVKKSTDEYKQYIFQDLSYRFSWDRLGGIDYLLKEIQSTILSAFLMKDKFKQLNIQPTKGFLINGSIGSGKTVIGCSILSYLKNMHKFQTFLINSGSLMASSDSDQVLNKLFELAEETEPSVIFIDDIDLLCQKDTSSRKGSNQQILFGLFDKMNRVSDKQIFFLGSTSSLQKVDISVKKCGRFQKIITINNMNDVTRGEVIKKLIDNVSHSLLQNELLQINAKTSGYVVSDLVMMIKEASLNCVVRYNQINGKTNNNSDPINVQVQGKQVGIKLQYEDIEKALSIIQPILKKEGFANIPETKLSDIGALKELKEELLRQIILPLKQKEKFRKMNFEINGAGVLLYGPPGCGKTMLAKAIANEAGANFIIVKGPQLLTKYVGESEEAVRKVFERARMSSPCIIFFDEFDALAPKRQDQGNQVTERVVNTLLNELNGVDERKMVFVIAATNRPDIIDQAVLRSGRIEKHLYVPLPNNEEREDILKTIATKVSKSQDINFKDLAKKCDGFSGADLRYLIKQSTVMAIMENRSYIQNSDLIASRAKYQKDKVGKNKLSLKQSGKQRQNQQIEQLGQNNINKNQKIQMENQFEQMIKNGQNVKKQPKSKLLNEFIQFMQKKYK